MVYLHELAETSFILVQADWTADQTLQLIMDENLLKATHVIVHRVEPDDDFYYLYTRREAIRQLKHVDEKKPVKVAFNLHESGATETGDAYDDASLAPDRIVIMDKGDILGFYDVTIPPNIAFTHIRGPQDSEPVPRSLIVECPRKVHLEDTVSLLVYLSAEMAQVSEALPSMPISIPRGSTVEVLVQPRSGFELMGPNRSSITVADSDETLPLHFKLKATELGTGEIHILAFRQETAQPLGRIILVPQIVEKAAAVDEKSVKFYQDMAPIRVHQPDLSLLILESTVNGRMELTMRLTTKDQSVQKLPFYGPVRFERSPAEYFTYFFKDIDNLQGSTPEKRAIAESRLGSKGLELFETLIPKELQVLLWALKDRIKTVQILSEEPWIPWELCKLQGEEEGWVKEGDFLCEAFNITRWFVDPQLEQRATLTFNKMGLVVPKGSRLPHATEEKEYLLNLANSEREIQEVPAKFLGLRSALASGQYDVWHFTGHGSFQGATPNRSAMELEEHQRLMPEDLNGPVKNLGQAHPLVFLNACEVGQGGMSLTGIGGWSARFIKVGAAAFIGAYWSIFDEQALNFAKEFYKGLLDDGLPIGEAVRQARLAIKQEGEPTRLAYTVFADPLATVQT